MNSITAMGAILSSVWNDESNHEQRVQRVLRAAGWQAWKRVFRSPLQVSLFNGMKFRAYPDCTISSSTLYFRVPNSRHVNVVRQHIRRGTLLDVGAHVGLFSLLVADKVDHAILFEPNPIAAGRARENVGINRLSFEVVALAASDESGEAMFENTGGASPVNRLVAGLQTSARTITVRRQPLDEFLSAHRPKAPVSMVKIDVEGHENSVFRGMQKCLRDDRPLVMFEYLARTCIKDAFKTLSSAGYQVLGLSDRGHLELATLSVKPLQDLFACPEETCAQLVA
jgi:FkbM family methyltransferase